MKAPLIKARYLTQVIQELALDQGKMAFLSGPRQSGKSTLARRLIPGSQTVYCNWDQSEFRRLWAKSPSKIWEQFKKHQGHLVLDELHKAKNWKRTLKGLYDDKPERVTIMVAGSARLDVFRKGGDSLLGRYFPFHLLPFSTRELLKGNELGPEKFLMQSEVRHTSEIHEAFNEISKMSGFPDPLLRSSQKFQRVWTQNRNERLIREDLRDLSRLPELSQIEVLCSLLPEKVGSPLSVQSLREDLEVAHDTVTRWLNYLKQLYYYFEVRPYSKSIPRSLKKEAKVYLYDWTEVVDPGARFENIVAFYLHKACMYWNNSGEGIFELFYLRNKEKQEVDFLIVRDRKPWVSFECKFSAGWNHQFEKFQRFLKCPHIQLVAENGVCRRKSGVFGDNWEVSAGSFFAQRV